MTTPFDDIRALINDLSAAPPLPDADPALGRLGEAAAFLRAWRGASGVLRPILALYAGSGGRNPVGVREQLEAVAGGAAPQARLVQAAGAGLEAFDLAIERPLPDRAQEAAMSERDCAATMAFGMEALAKTPDLLMPAILGDEDGAGAAAVALALFGGQASDWTASGAQAIQAAADRAGPGLNPLEALRQLGDRPMTAVVGSILAARVQGVPVLLDGFTPCVAAAVLQALDPRATDHCLAAHLTGHPGHAAILQRLGLKPLVDLELNGEGGLGAVAALGLVKAAAALV